MNRNVVLSYDEVCERFKNKGLKLLTKEYKNNHTLLDCEDKDGYRFNITSNSIDTFTQTKLVYTKNKWSLYNINKYIENNNIGVKLLSQVYEGSNARLTFRCKCGNEFKKPWNDFYGRKRYYCPKCMKENNPKKYSFEFIQAEFKKRGLTILDSEYIANGVPLLCVTEEGYKIYKSYTNLKGSADTFIFSYTHNKDNYVYNMNLYLKKNNIDLECLEVLPYKPYPKGSNYFEARCACGNIFLATLDYIKRGHYKCVDCLGFKSNGEKMIAEYLDSKKITYQREFKFSDCRHKSQLSFDFYLPKYNTCIEYDGQQHYRKRGNSTSEDFKERLLRDEIKDKYCKEHNITLIRVPYFDINKINEYIDKLPLK